MAVLTILRGDKQLSAKALEVLRQEGQVVLRTSVDKEIGEPLPPIDPKDVVTEPATYGSRQFRRNLHEQRALVVSAKYDHIDMALRIIDEVVYIAYDYLGKISYAEVHLDDFSKALHMQRANTALVKVRLILDKIAGNAVPARMFIAPADGWEYPDLVKKMGWDWRRGA